MQIIMNKVFIPLATSVKYLGIEIELSLNFCTQIENIEKKISVAIGVLCKLKQLAPIKILLSIYHSLIYPHLIYGVLLWGNF